MMTSRHRQALPRVMHGMAGYGFRLPALALVVATGASLFGADVTAEDVHVHTSRTVAQSISARPDAATRRIDRFSFTAHTRLPVADAIIRRIDSPLFITGSLPPASGKPLASWSADTSGSSVQPRMPPGFSAADGVIDACGCRHMRASMARTASVAPAARSGGALHPARAGTPRPTRAPTPRPAAGIQKTTPHSRARVRRRAEARHPSPTRPTRSPPATRPPQITTDPLQLPNWWMRAWHKDRAN